MMASPFHSDKVHAEVELLRSRPLTLDQDAQRVGADVDETSLGDRVFGGQEPPYFQEDFTGEAVRLARLESSSEGGRPLTQEPRAVPPPQAMSTRVSEPGHIANAVSPLQPPEVRTVLEEERVSAAGATRSPEDMQQPAVTPVSLGPGSVRVAEVQPLNAELVTRPLPDDVRELVPALPSSGGGLEALLMQVIQENHALRMRVDQMETQSSWHSGRTQTTHPDPDADARMSSPVSLMHRSVGADMTSVAGRVAVQTRVRVIEGLLW